MRSDRRSNVCDRSRGVALRDVALQVEALEDRSLLSIVGFVDDRESGIGDADYIRAAGHTPVVLSDADLTPDVLNQLDALIIALGNGDRPESLMANYSNVLNWVQAGGALIIHDSNPVGNAQQDIVPGLDDATFVWSPSAEMNVLDSNAPIVNGLFGTVMDDTLDNGCYSNHGYVMAESLPGDVDQVMDADLDPSHVAVVQYAFGNGTTIYSTIPAEFYTNGNYLGDFATRLGTTYLRNELNAALTLANPTGEYAPAEFALQNHLVEVNQAGNGEDDGQVVENGDGNGNDNGDAGAEDNPGDPPAAQRLHWDNPQGQIVVGFVDDREQSDGDASYITAAGFLAVQLNDADLDPETLSHLDVLIIGLGNEDRPERLMANFPNVLAWVHAGGALIIHDSNPSANANQDIVPGLDEANFIGIVPSQEMNVLNANSLIVNGPFGEVTNETLDGGGYSNHGYVLAESLPDGVDQVMNTDFDSNHIAVMQYEFGKGNVIYSTIPAEFYTKPDYGGVWWPDFAARLETTYLRNEIYAAVLGANPVGGGWVSAIDQSEDVTDETADQILICIAGDGLLIEDNLFAQATVSDEPDSAIVEAEESENNASQDALADDQALQQGLLVADVLVEFTEILNAC
jgi:hypothetical protein